MGSRLLIQYWRPCLFCGMVNSRYSGIFVPDVSALFQIEVTSLILRLMTILLFYLIGFADYVLYYVFRGFKVASLNLSFFIFIFLGYLCNHMTFSSG